MDLSSSRENRIFNLLLEKRVIAGNHIHIFKQSEITLHSSRPIINVVTIACGVMLKLLDPCSEKMV